MISKLKRYVRICFDSIMLRGMSILLLIVVLIFAVQTVLLVNTTKQMIFSSKESALMNEAETITSAMNSSTVLSGDMAEEIMDVLGINESEIVFITDENAVVLYSSDTMAASAGICALYPELVSALHGNDVFHCELENNVFQSIGAMPILSSGKIVGAVFLAESDSDQAALLDVIRKNIFDLAAIFLLIGLVVYLIFAVVIVRKNTRMLLSIHQVQDGDYSHRISEKGHDEFSALAFAFNQMTDKLQENEQTRRQFVSDASHELRTPLAAIRLLSDSIIENNMDPDTVREFVQDISDESDRLTRMTTKLLSLTALDSRQMEKIDLVPVSLGACCKKTVRMISPLAATHGTVIEESSEDDCYILAAEDDIFQVVLNLTENGIKYSGENGKVRLIAYTQSNQAYLIVEDNGVGIPEAELDRIFERFYRVDKARSRAAGGSGLGLSIVHDTVVKYGGTVEASNRVQGGARFTVSFPAFNWEGET